MNHMLSWRAQLLDTDLHRNAKYLALILSTYMNEWGDSAFPAVSTLAGRSGMSKRTIDKAIADLVEAGWLIKQNRFREDGGKTTNNYVASHPEYHAQSLREGTAKSAHPLRKACAYNSSVNSSPKPIERGRFAPPSAQDVKDYWAEKFFDGDPMAFRDHYESVGWVVGKKKMKDWKAAARGWARREAQYARNRPERPVKGAPKTPRQWQQWCRRNGHGDGPRGFSEEQFVSWATDKYRRSQLE